MGNTSSNQSLKEFQSNYVFNRMIVDQRFGECRILQQKSTKEEILMKEINLSDQGQFQHLIKKLNQRVEEPHPNLVNLQSSLFYQDLFLLFSEIHSQEDSQFCGTFFKLYLIFEYVELTLEKLAGQYKLQNIYISESLMWQIMMGCVNGLSRLQQQNITHQAIRPNTISFKQDQNQPKVCDPTLFNTTTSFAQVLQNFNGNNKGIYLSPQQIKALELGQYQPSCNPYKSDVFSLGMALLSIGTLESCDNCYRYEDSKFLPTEMEKKINLLERYYPQNFTQIVRGMLEMEEDQRPDFVQLKQELSNVIVPPLSASVTPSQIKGLSQPPSYRNIPDQKPYEEVQQSKLRLFLPSLYEAQNNLNHPSAFSTPKQVKQAQVTRQSQQLKESQPSTQSQKPMNGAQQKLNQDKPDIIFPTNLNDAPALESEIDENIGNELGQHAHEPSPQHEDNIIQQLTGLMQPDYHPVTAKVPTNERSYNIENIHQSYQLEQPKYDNQIHLITTNKSSYQPQDIHTNYQVSNQYQSNINYSSTQKTDNFAPQSQQKTYDFLYNKELNTAEKMSQYQDQLQKKFQISTPFDQPIKNSNLSLTKPAKENVVETYQNGSRYEGEKSNGMRHGKGRFFYQDGGIYDGEWSENKMHGNGIIAKTKYILGTLYYASGQPAYQGQWVDDKFEGEGILYNEMPQALDEEFDYTDLDNIQEFWTKYDGSFHDDNKEGMGTLFLSNGERFQGYFLQDLASGPGKFFNLHGEQIEGHWWHNKYQY